MHFKLTFVVVFLAVALLALVPPSNADCCGSWYSYGDAVISFDRCADCTKPQSFYCAVEDSGCNVFGCNCDGGCRQPVEGRECSETCCDKRSGRKARNADVFMPVPLKGNFSGVDVMNHVDMNKDGRLDEVEIKIFVTRHGLPADAWRHLDADGDDHLTAHEIDSDLVPLSTDVA